MIDDNYRKTAHTNDILRAWNWSQSNTLR